MEHKIFFQQLILYYFETNKQIAKNRNHLGLDLFILRSLEKTSLRRWYLGQNLKDGREPVTPGHNMLQGHEAKINLVCLGS